MHEARGSKTAHRILVYGVTGSGKTTAAARISEATGIPWTAVDDLTWAPGWAAVPGEEQRGRIAQVCARQAWILDAAYGPWIDLPLARADLVLALDYQRWFSLQRLVRRTLRRLLSRPRICNGNVETLRSVLGNDSIIRWHFRSFRSKRERIRAWEAERDGPQVLRFTRPRDLDRWIAGLRPVQPLTDEQAG